MSLPVTAAAGVLTLGQVYAVTAGSSALTVIFGITYHSFYPHLVGEGQLTEANSRIASTEAVARGADPAVGGALVGALDVSRAVLVDAASFAVSLYCLTRVRPHRRREPGSTGTLRSTVGDGFAVLQDLSRRFGSARLLMASNALLPAGYLVLLARPDAPSTLTFIPLLGGVGAEIFGTRLTIALATTLACLGTLSLIIGLPLQRRRDLLPEPRPVAVGSVSRSRNGPVSQHVRPVEVRRWAFKHEVTEDMQHALPSVRLVEEMGEDPSAAGCLFRTEPATWPNA